MQSYFVFTASSLHHSDSNIYFFFDFGRVNLKLNRTVVEFSGFSLLPCPIIIFFLQIPILKAKAASKLYVGFGPTLPKTLLWWFCFFVAVIKVYNKSGKLLEKLIIVGCKLIFPQPSQWISFNREDDMSDLNVYGIYSNQSCYDLYRRTILNLFEPPNTIWESLRKSTYWK